MGTTNCTLLKVFTILILDFNAIPVAGNGVFCRVDGHSSLFFSILGLVIRSQVC